MRFSILVLLFIFPFVQAEERVPWESSRILGSPEPALPFARETVWPHLTFDEPVDITPLSNAGRLFLTERKGRIWMLPDNLSLDTATPELCLDLKTVHEGMSSLYGLAFHPNFANDRRAYLFYVARDGTGPSRTWISEFSVDAAHRFDLSSERRLLFFGSGGHNGGDLHFGPDGMLYFSIGDLDGPSPPDIRNVGQNLANLASTICRIDVDRQDEGLNYAIPKDNPFVGREGARPEIYAYGLRNPWKMSFDPLTGNLWTGDVGWEQWESVFKIEKGGNYGWSIMEGPLPLKTDQAKGPTPILPPFVYYGHEEGASITGGVVVRGKVLPDLEGHYVYGDYLTGKIWAIDTEGPRGGPAKLLADARRAIVSFAQLSSGEILFIDYPEPGHIYRLIPNSDKDQTNAFPRQLSQTGLFRSTAPLEPEAGVYEYQIQAPMWHDGYSSRYWIASPGDSGFGTIPVPRRGYFMVRYNKPENAVLAKTIFDGERPIETQILHFDGSWNGYTYQWNDEQTDAELVPSGGRSIEVDGKPYRIPSRNECIRCHGSNFNYLLAFFPGQLNRDGQIQRFQKLGLVDEKFEELAKSQPFVDPTDSELPIELRARSWMHANCTYCHRLTGGTNTSFQTSVSAPLDSLFLIDEKPTKGYFGLDGGSLVKAGNPYQSIFYYRIATRGAGHMPMIGATTPDHEGIRLVHDWIRSLDSNAPATSISLNPKGVDEALALYHRISEGELTEEERQQAIANCMSHSDPFVIGLFAQFAYE